jgi:hypothetical protein
VSAPRECGANFFRSLVVTGPLVVLYETTENNFDGSSWPPDGNDLWSVVSRANGSTTWRRIMLSNRNFRSSLAPAIGSKQSAPRRGRS